MTYREAKKLKAGDRVGVKGRPAVYFIADKPSYTGDPIWFALRSETGGDVLLRNHWALMRVP